MVYTANEIRMLDNPKASILSILCFCCSLMAFAVPELRPRQTAAELQAQKDLAGNAVLPRVPEDSKTPLKLFDSCFTAMSRIDSSEFDRFTKEGIADYFDDSGELTDEVRKTFRSATGVDQNRTGLED